MSPRSVQGAAATAPPRPEAAAGAPRRHSPRSLWTPLLVAALIATALPQLLADPGRTLAARREAFSRLLRIDHYFQQRTRGEVFLLLAGFDAEDPGHEEHAAALYYRAAFALYPRRIRVAPPERRIDRGRDIFAAQAAFRPDDDWLRRQGISTLVEHRLEPDRAVRFRSRPVP